MSGCKKSVEKLLEKMNNTEPNLMAHGKKWFEDWNWKSLEIEWWEGKGDWKIEEWKLGSKGRGEWIYKIT